MHMNKNLQTILRVHTIHYPSLSSPITSLFWSVRLCGSLLRCFPLAALAHHLLHCHISDKNWKDTPVLGLWVMIFSSLHMMISSIIYTNSLFGISNTGMSMEGKQHSCPGPETLISQWRLHSVANESQEQLPLCTRPGSWSQANQVVSTLTRTATPTFLAQLEVVYTLLI